MTRNIHLFIFFILVTLQGCATGAFTQVQLHNAKQSAIPIQTPNQFRYAPYAGTIHESLISTTVTAGKKTTSKINMKCHVIVKSNAPDLQLLKKCKISINSLVLEYKISADMTRLGAFSNFSYAGSFFDLISKKLSDSDLKKAFMNNEEWVINNPVMTGKVLFKNSDTAGFSTLSMDPKLKVYKVLGRIGVLSEINILAEIKVNEFITMPKLGTTHVKKDGLMLVDESTMAIKQLNETSTMKYFDENKETVTIEAIRTQHMKYGIDTLL